MQSIQSKYFRSGLHDARFMPFAEEAESPAWSAGLHLPVI
jgi:hypothetical protein